MAEVFSPVGLPDLASPVDCVSPDCCLPRIVDEGWGSRNWSLGVTLGSMSQIQDIYGDMFFFWLRLFTSFLFAVWRIEIRIPP